MNVLCPGCGRKVMKHDGKGTIEIAARCSKCKKIVQYCPKTHKRIFIEEPIFESSGKRFY